MVHASSVYRVVDWDVDDVVGLVVDWDDEVAGWIVGGVMG